MRELTELRFNDDRVILKDNHVKTSILPMVSNELDRDVDIEGNCVLDGAVYARKMSIQNGPVRVKGAVFTQVELHVNTDSKGPIYFEKAVASAQAIVSHAPGARLHFLSDLSAKRIHLRNAYITGCLYADEIILEDCVVIGGVFATRSLELHNCIAGTFSSPTIRASKMIYLLLPSAFSVESISCLPGTEFFNLTLADLGSLMRGNPEQPNTGKIPMDVMKDEVRTVLVDGESQQVMRSYSVIGKVLAADLLDVDKLQNHFLLSCAGLSSQLAKTYDLGLDAKGQAVELSPDRIASFFFDILHRKIEVSELDGHFELSNIINRFRTEMGTESAPATRIPEQDAVVHEESTEVDEGDAPLELSENELGTLEDHMEEPETVEETRFCSNCGESTPEGGSFCEHCGTPLE